MKNQKIAVGIIGTILLIILGFALYSHVEKNPQVEESEQSSLTNVLLSHATLTVPGLDPVTVIELTGPTTQFSLFDDPSDPAYGTVTLIGNPAGDLQTLYAILAVNTGGSGTFYYLTAFEKTEHGFVSGGSQPLGDRIDFKKLEVTVPNTVTVSYLTHGPTQSMADKPNQEVNQAYSYTSGTFISN